eukprot:2672371-Alexandrium_andersonii.AAC.1
MSSLRVVNLWVRWHRSRKATYRGSFHMHRPCGSLACGRAGSFGQAMRIKTPDGRAACGCARPVCEMSVISD